MSVLSVQTLATGVSSSIPNTQTSQSSQPSSVVFITTNDVAATVEAAGYLSSVKSLYGNDLLDGSFVLVTTTDEGQQSYQISISGEIVSLIGKGAKISGTPVVNRIAHFSDADGTISSDPTDEITHIGSIILGENGTGGKVEAHAPSPNSGKFVFEANDNLGPHTVTLQNSPFAQTSGILIPDAGAAMSLMVSSITLCDPGANIITFDTVVDQAALASAGNVILFMATNGFHQYKIRSMWINSGGTNFSGGGGDRLLTINDGANDFSVIPAATLQTLVNSGWGDSADLPYPVSAPINTSTSAGADLIVNYSGGTADYTAGSITISGVMDRVA